MLADLFSGFFGGVCGIFVTHPLDTIRVRAQAASGSASQGYLHIVKDIVRKNGMKGLYAGVTPPVVLRGISFSANRGAFAFAKKRTRNPFLQGCFAGLVSGLFDTPIFLLKCRAQCSPTKIKETLRNYMKITGDIIRQEGIHGMFTGNIPNMILFTGSYGIFYWVYEQLRAKEVHPSISGVAACLASWPLLYPFDVLRTRASVVTRKTRWSREFFTFRYFARDMTASPVTLWFPGLSMTLVRAVPRFAVAMFVCEETKKSIERTMN